MATSYTSNPRTTEQSSISHPSELSSLPFSLAAERWLENHSRYIKPRTLKGYREYFARLNEFFGDMSVDSLTIGHVRHYQTERGKKAGPNRINQELSALHQVLREAGCWNEIGTLYKALPGRKTKSGHSLTPEQEKHLREVAFSRPKWRVAAH
jgi:hypothetical protein